MCGMNDEGPKPERSKWWMPPEQLNASGVAEFAPLVALATVGWAIAGFFISLAARLRRLIRAGSEDEGK